MTCECRDLAELNGSAAQDYARGHLDKLETDPVEWTIQYRCPETGAKWVMDHPHSELQGGGSPRLRRTDPA
jgi:Immunity protein 27